MKLARFYCGACGWNYASWKSRFYPDDLSQNQWLGYYSSRLDTVEINNSFYRLPERTTFEHWRDETPCTFTFAVKASRYLTHLKKLKDPEAPLELLLAHSDGLGTKRGPILFQLPPNWRVDLTRLRHFLSILPQGVRAVFEFRDDSWHCEEVWSLLSNYSVAYCIMDHPSLPTHLRTTGDFAYIRFHYGDEAAAGDYTDALLTVWAGRVERLMATSDVYAYFNNDQYAFAVHNALKLRSMVLGRSDPKQ